MSFTGPANSVSSTGYTQCESLITPDQLKQRYLFGVDLTDKDGNPMPTETIQHNINTAVSYLEHKLDILILKRRFIENYDYRTVDYSEFNFIQLKHRPLNDLELLRAKFPNDVELVRYPKEWYVQEKESSQIQLSPVAGTFSGLIVTQGGAYLPLIYGTRSHWPHLFEVTYTAGFDEDKIPTVINDLVGMQAAIHIFEILGDIILGQGIGSETVGLDGANTSRVSTAAAGISGFAARIESYRKQIKEYVVTIKQHYNGLPFVVG